MDLCAPRAERLGDTIANAARSADDQHRLARKIERILHFCVSPHALQLFSQLDKSIDLIRPLWHGVNGCEGFTNAPGDDDPDHGTRTDYARRPALVRKARHRWRYAASDRGSVRPEKPWVCQLLLRHKRSAGARIGCRRRDADRYTPQH